MDSDFLLHSGTARELYGEVAALPLIDWHNHLSVADLREDRQYRSVTELWIDADPYKHRAMRICGVPEKFITGDADDFDKFAAWSRTLPRLAGNPLYCWSIMELERVFGITERLDDRSAASIYRRINEMLSGKDFSVRAILRRFSVRIAAPCVGLSEDLSAFDKIPGVVPSFRGDDAAALRLPPEWAPRDMADLRALLRERCEQLHRCGCRFADHALDGDFVYAADDGGDPARFSAWRRGEATPDDLLHLRSEVLRIAAGEYARCGWVLQLHVGALRRTSDRLRALSGPFGGYAAIAAPCDMTALVALLNDLERAEEGMPRIILYALNPADHVPFAALGGAFTGDGVRGQLRLGPAWWYCDHRTGIRDCLNCTAAFGVLSLFPGMTTDSRTPLSFVRHEYFRRVMCDFLAEKAGCGELPRDGEILRDLAYRLSYGNAWEFFREGEE